MPSVLLGKLCIKQSKGMTVHVAVLWGLDGRWLHAEVPVLPRRRKVALGQLGVGGDCVYDVILHCVHNVIREPNLASIESRKKSY